MAGYRPANRGNRSSNRTGATVSRMLRAAGHNVVSPDHRHVRQCMTVRSAGDHVSVLVDYGYLAKNERVAADVEATVRSWPQVSDVQVRTIDDGAVYVSLTYTPMAKLSKVTPAPEQKEDPVIELKKVTSEAEIVTHVQITGAPVTEVKYTDRTVVPDGVTLTYVYKQGGEGHRWVCQTAKVHGQRVLKPGPNGEQRIGKDRHSTEWFRYSGRCLTDGGDVIPAWLPDVIHELRPSGDLDLH